MDKKHIAKFVPLVVILVFVGIVSLMNIVNNPNPKPPSSRKNGEDMVKSHDQNEKPTDSEPNNKYLLKLEGDTVCAYTVTDGVYTMVASGECGTLLLSDEELHKLREGIFTQSYEELCMSFESYAS